MLIVIKFQDFKVISKSSPLSYQYSADIAPYFWSLSQKRSSSDVGTYSPPENRYCSVAAKLASASPVAHEPRHYHFVKEAT